jgi:hypothetical protein
MTREDNVYPSHVYRRRKPSWLSVALTIGIVVGLYWLQGPADAPWKNPPVVPIRPNSSQETKAARPNASGRVAADPKSAGRVRPSANSRPVSDTNANIIPTADAAANGSATNAATAGGAVGDSTNSSNDIGNRFAANSPSGESSASTSGSTDQSPQTAAGDSSIGSSATGSSATGDSESGDSGTGDTPRTATSVSKLENGGGAPSVAAVAGNERADGSGGQSGDSNAGSIPTVEPPRDRLATSEPIPDFAAADDSSRAGDTRGKSSTFGLVGDRAKDGRYSLLVPNVVIRDLAGKVVYRGEIDLRETMKRIDAGTKLSFPNDGSVFQNREQLLPKKAAGHYREWVHRTPGLAGPGPQRVVTGANGEAYYTSDHYGTFRRVR